MSISWVALVNPSLRTWRMTRLKNHLRTFHLGFSLVTAGGDVIAKSARGYEQKGECLVSIGLVKLATNDLIRDLGKLDPTGEA